MDINIKNSTNNQEYWSSKFKEKWLNSCFVYDYEENHYNKLSITRKKISLPKEISTKMLDMSNGSDYRLHMILVASVMCILHEYISEDELMVWTSIYKQEADHEFINTILPIRNSIEKNMSFKQFLLQIKNNIIEATENQNYPIEKLLRELYSVQYESQSSLINVAILLDNIQDKSYIEQYNPKLLFLFNRIKDELELTIEYNSSLYDDTSIERISQNLCVFLQKILFEVDKVIDDVEIISNKEREQLLIDFNNTEVNYDLTKTIPKLFEECVDKYPNDIAVVYEDKKISYKELNEKSNQVANALFVKGVNRDNVIAIYMKPSIEIIVAIIATLKAGVAYVPIDVSYPKERVQHIISDSGAIMLITDNESDITNEFEGEVINILNTSFNTNSKLNLDRAVDGDSLAYVIYTSGSTGKTKGVSIEHRSILNSVLWYRKYFSLSEESNVLQPASFSFDASVLLIFSTLISGGKLVIINQKELLNQEKFRNVITNNSVTHLSLVPSIYNTILRNENMGFNNLKRVVLAGESLNEQLVKEHFSKIGNVKLYNGYGPTENSVCTTVYEFTPNNTKILIGKPLDNTKCFILRNNKLLPIGAVGELYISGAGLAREYINNETLTKERFRECPFIQGSKMYKTGDLARFDNNGELKFFGRCDQQVKINGYRIELGEIENSILEIEGIKDALVAELNDEKVGNFICAYIVCNDDIDAEFVRKSLVDKLPRFMVPSFFVKIDKIPRNVNGKIDNNKLMNPLKSLKEIDKYEPPKNDLEAKLCKIYERVLGVDNIGIKNNYFHIGGDSIKSINLTNSINEELDIKLQVSDIYNNQTIKQLAVFINSNCNEDHSKYEEEKYKEAMDELNMLKESIISRR